MSRENHTIDYSVFGTAHLFTLLCNLLTIYVTFSTPRLRNIKSAFIVSNSFSDALYTLVSVILNFYIIDNSISKSERDVFQFIFLSHDFIAYGNIFLISVQQWLLFVHPFVHKRLATTRVAVISISLNWISPFILSAFFFIKTDRRIYTGYIFPVIHCVVFFFIIFFSISIYRVLNKHYGHIVEIDKTMPDKDVYTNHLKRIKKKRSESTCMLFTVCFLYFVFITPYTGGWAYMDLANKYNAVLIYITQASHALSHMSNFFTYVLRCPNFKASLKVKWESALGLMRKILKLDKQNLNSKTETELEIFAVQTISFNTVRDTTTLSTHL